MSSAGFIGAGTNRRMRRKSFGSIVSGIAIKYGPPDDFIVRLARATRGAITDGLALTRFIREGQDRLGQINLPVSANLASNPAPGQSSGVNGWPVSALDEELEIGASYLLEYYVSAVTAGATLYLPAGAGSPFSNTVTLPTTVGYHPVIVTAEDADTIAAMRATGDITISFFAVRKAQWSYPLADASPGDLITFEITRGVTTTGRTVEVPENGRIYVDEFGGDDVYGTGAIGSPFRQIQTAIDVSRPGDTIYARPGRYRPFQIVTSGTDGNPITVTTLPGEELLAMVEGDLLTDQYYGGPGGQEAEATRDCVYGVGVDHINIRNLMIRNAHRHGVGFFGVEGEQHGNIEVTGCHIRMTGASSIFISGAPASDPLIPDTEIAIEDMRLRGILIANNNYGLHNVVTDLNNNTSNPQGEPGGVSEGITIVASVGDFIVEDNWQEVASRQYGIDVKAGVRDGIVRRNRVVGSERFGFYADASSRFVIDVDFYDNVADNCNIGFVMARESRADGATPVLRNVRWWNNIARNSGTTGFLLQDHPEDKNNGDISGIVIAFNTSVDAARTVGTGREFSLTGWDKQEFRDNNVISGTGVRIFGNVAWRSDGSTQVLTPDTGDGFTVFDNFNFANEDTAPGFVDFPQDLTPGSGSPVIGFVTTPGAVVPPYVADAEGTDRGDQPSAGAILSDFEVNTVANISALNVSDQSAGDVVEVDYTIDMDSTVSAVITNSATKPSPAQIIAGQNHLGASARQFFATTFTTDGGLFALSITDGIAPGTYFLHVLPNNGSASDIQTSNGFALDTTVSTPGGIVPSGPYEYVKANGSVDPQPIAMPAGTITPGNNYLVFYGPTRTASSLAVGARDIAATFQDGPNVGALMSMFQFAGVAGDENLTQLDFTLFSADNEGFFTIFDLGTTSLIDYDFGKENGTTPMSLSAQPVGSSGQILLYSLGRDPNYVDALPTVANLSMDDLEIADLGNGEGLSYGIHPLTSSNEVTETVTGASRFAVFLGVIE